MKDSHTGFIRKCLIILLVIPFLVSDCGSPDAKKDNRQKYNVLFIAVDDLRPNLGCYGDPVAVTPNIDQLASNGMLFSRAYCQQAVCAPSRASIMTGLRPDNLRVWDLQTHFRENIPDVVTLPQYFKKHGYYALEVGKIYHDPLRAKDPQSWSAPSTLHVTQNGRGHKYMLDENCTGKMKAAATEMADVHDTSYIDGKVCLAAIGILNDIKDSTFFLAVGFRRPHLPFSSPVKYWDLYKPEELPLVKNAAPPAGVPEIALHNWRELRGYTDMPLAGDIDAEDALRLRWGYYAATSYIDEQIGILVDELKRLDLYSTTVIVLWADHGFHLGEHNLWCKITNFELDTRVPLIICLPEQKTAGTRTNAIVELVDVYPTLADVCGFAIPEGLDGQSLKPLLEDPEAEWDKPAISQFPRPGYYRVKPEFMGYSMRTDQYRYTKWIRIDTGEDIARELYDHFTDPGEEVNLAKVSKYKVTIADLDRNLMHEISDGYQKVIQTFKDQ
ncbi:MAG: sulfatase [Bacteroidales bacterium]|nr:sulfatase [Bacteroidales bacterium]